jgi:uncharacterized protein YkwD
MAVPTHLRESQGGLNRYLILYIFVAGFLMLGILAADANAQEDAAPSEESSDADFVNTVLEVHNRERAEFGVPDLVWSDTLAAGAKTWAEHLATTKDLFIHDPDNTLGENLAGFNPSKWVNAQGEGLQLWIEEKENYHGERVTADNIESIGHYAQMVRETTKEVGCVTASGSGHPFSILVCRYNPK